MIQTKIAQIAQRSRASAVISAVGIFVVALALAYAGVHLFELQSEISGFHSDREKLEAEIRSLENRNKEQSGQTAATGKELAETKSEIARLTTLALGGLGFKHPEKGNAATLERSLAARDLAAKLAAGGAKRRAQIKLRYYPSDFERYLNGDLVLSQLKRYGFQIEEAGARVAAIPVNAVWCGSGVLADDARLVALVLTTAGVDIKAVRPFREPADPKKAHAIEIGSDASFARGPTLSAQDIMASADFLPQRP